MKRQLEDHHPDDAVRNGLGFLARNRSRTRDGDPDLVGSLRLEGRIIRVRGWVVQTDSGAGIRLAAQEPGA